MSRRIIPRAVGGTAAAALLAAAGLAAGPAESAPPRDLQAAKAATARYHSVQQALADGYVAAPDCVRSPAGTMGVHYENPELMDDPALDVRRPEILVYVPEAGGDLRLAAVEYHLEADEAHGRPALFGRGFDGPMPAHHPGMEAHYDLHVWLWADNPRGLFAPFNPNVSCD